MKPEKPVPPPAPSTAPSRPWEERTESEPRRSDPESKTVDRELTAWLAYQLHIND